MCKPRLERALGCTEGLVRLNTSNCALSHGMTGQVTSTAAADIGACPFFVQKAEEEDLSNRSLDDRWH